MDAAILQALRFWGLTVIGALVLFFIPEVVGRVGLALDSSYRSLAVVPLAIALVYAMMRVNYSRFQALEKRSLCCGGPR